MTCIDIHCCSLCGQRLPDGKHDEINFVDMVKIFTIDSIIPSENPTSINLILGCRLIPRLPV